MSALFDDTDFRTDTERDLPPLTGSAKQLPWAGYERAKAFWAMGQLLREWRLLVDRYRENGNQEAADREWRLYSEALTVLAALEQETRAWIWIDGREFTAREWLSGKLPERAAGYGR
jgi:hypothetical protein